MRLRGIAGSQLRLLFPFQEVLLVGLSTVAGDVYYGLLDNIQSGPGVRGGFLL